MRAVSCGHNHTVCSSANGRVFSWGDNTSSQCGVVGQQVIAHPCHVPIVAHCDETQKLVLSESVEVAESCRNGMESDVSDGQVCSRIHCCHSRSCHASQTGCSGRLVNVVIVDVSCGWTHTAVLSNSSKLWSCGTGVQVGIPDLVSVPVPYPVEFPASRQVIHVSCGGRHTVAITIRRETNRFGAAVVNEMLKTDISRTDRCNPGTNESIKLNSVPAEAKKGPKRHQQKSDRNLDAEEMLSVSDEAVGVNIAMQKLASSDLGESAGDDCKGTDCVAECELASTCIDDACASVGITTKLYSQLDGHSENTDITVDESQADSAILNVGTDGSGLSCSTVPKSRSSFLDETEAKMFLEKQLLDTTSTSGGGSIMTADGRTGKERNVSRKEVTQDGAVSMSPFAKTVESLLQHVPSSPVVQEYVSNLTRTMVTNLRTSVDRRLSYVTSQVELSLNALASLNKVAEPGIGEGNVALDDTALLQRLALASCVSRIWFFIVIVIIIHFLIVDRTQPHIWLHAYKLCINTIKYYNKEYDNSCSIDAVKM